MESPTNRAKPKRRALCLTKLPNIIGRHRSTVHKPRAITREPPNNTRRDITKRQRLTVRDTSFREELWALDNRARQSYLARQCIGRGA